MKTFIITLTKIPAAMDMAKIAHSSAKQYGYDPAIFDAYTGIDGRNYLRDNNIKPIHKAAPIVLQHQSNWLTRDGTIGCFASHHRLWRNCVKLNETIIILEQDVQMLRPWDDALEWQDILHLNCHGSLIRQQNDSPYDSAAPIQDGVFEMKFLTRHFDMYTMNAAFGYAINPQAAAKLVKSTKKDGWMAADRFIRSPLVKIDTINPPIVVEQPEALLHSLSSRKILR